MEGEEVYPLTATILARILVAKGRGGFEMMA